MKQLTKQEIFDRVAAHLLKQGRKSEIREGLCAYRGEGDLKCAVGCLIPDDVYSDTLESLTVFALPLGVVRAGGFEWEPEFTHRLQVIHDVSPTELWRENLTALAREYKLDDGVLK